MDNKAVPGTQRQPFRLELLAASCVIGSCPTVYVTDRGTVVVQGYAISETEAGLTLAPGEGLVEIPSDLLAQAASRLT